MIERERLVRLCQEGLLRRGLTDPRYQVRFDEEMQEIDAQAEYDYFLDLYDAGAKFESNEHNLITAYLLGLVDEFDIEVEAAFLQGESPDIDIDYLPLVREYLKNKWAPETFGRDKVCSIGTYGTLGIKSTLKDMTRVHGIPRDEIEMIAKKIPDKDDDGHELEWEKAVALVPELKDYCERYPDVAEAVQVLLERNKSGGVHPGGLIISSVPIADFVPLEVRSVTKDNKYGVICSAWGEGLRTQDLGPVGLVKFDLLVVDGIRQIALATNLIRKRHGIDKVCALPGQLSWSDVTYLNDPAALDLADKADTKHIFQFGKDGARKLLKMGGVDNFHDIAAYSALNRPGPMNMGMDVKYCDRKKGREKYNLHPLMQPILGYTYGVMCYQEQVMQILNMVGDIPLIHCEKIRKAISKKKIAQFIKYKEMFLKNGQKNLGATEEYVQNLWDQVEAFADYGFNKSVTVDTLIPSALPDGTCVNRKIQDFRPGYLVYSVNEAGDTVETEVVALHDHGYLEGYEVTFDDGYSVICSIDHKFLNEKGQQSLRDIIGSNSFVLCDPSVVQEKSDAQNQGRWLEESLWGEAGKQASDACAQQVVCEMSGDDVHYGIMAGSLRQGLQNQRVGGKTSTDMRTVSTYGLENKKSGWSAKDSRRAQSSMRRDASDISDLGGPSAGVPPVRVDQAGQHQGKESQDQPIGGASSQSFRNSQKNFGSSRDSGRTSGTVEGVAGGQSGRVRQMHRGGLEIVEAVPHGSVASVPIELGDGVDPLRKPSSASGFCEGACLDRGGRILPLQRTSSRSQKASAPGRSTTTGCDVECGGEEAWEYHAPASEHGMFQEFVGGDEARVVPATPGHAGIADARGMVLRRVVRVVPVGKRRMYDLEVASSTHNFLLTNGIVTSNSHSYAYSYISARQLWLMAHYPMEFYTACFMCKTDSAEIKAVKLDAEQHGIELSKVSINNSEINFAIKSDEEGKEKVFFGFSNLKKIGEVPAEKIVEHQPYDGITDFIQRYGSDGTVIKALISLGVFCEPEDRLKYYKFVEYWKDWHKKRISMRERFKETLERYDSDLANLVFRYAHLIEDIDHQAKMSVFSEEAYELWEKYFSDTEEDQPYNYKGEARTRKITVLKHFHEVKRKREQSIKNNQSKELLGEESPPTLESFNPNHCNVKIKEDVEILMTGDPRLAESEYYGWQWEHDLERCEDYMGYTFEWLNANIEGKSGIVEIQIKEVVPTISKKGKEYYVLVVEDANGQEEKITMWTDDYMRFAEELVAGNLMKMRVVPPEGNWSKYGFDAPPQHQRWTLPKNKYQDCRLALMSLPIESPPPVEVVETTVEEDVAFLLEDF